VVGRANSENVVEVINTDAGSYAVPVQFRTSLPRYRYLHVKRKQYRNNTMDYFNRPPAKCHVFYLSIILYRSMLHFIRCM